MVAADGRGVELADPGAIGARSAARTEALAADASRPEAKAIAALLRALPPARRAELATADIRALVAPASPELADPAAPAGPLRTVTTVETHALAGGRPVPIDRPWRLDTASGLVPTETPPTRQLDSGHHARRPVEEKAAQR